MKNKHPQVDEYLRKATRWQKEMKTLRRIVLGCRLTEDWKWRAPCYTLENGNVAMIGGFKEYCALSFFKGALLKDPQGLLVTPGENTQAARLIRFTSVPEIEAIEPSLEAYLHEAMEVERAGLKVDFKKNDELVLPEELLSKFAELPALETAFDALTPGRQRAYAMYFSAPKQSKTRTSRIENYQQRILARKGFNDCVCGHTQKPPACDGSHKNFG
jgi:uncharacterized protein YdeI (YjbR/CyaY-like superfamily)